FSGHEMLAPTGIGALWGRAELLERMSPFILGGSMIRKVTGEHTSWNELPYKFEGGTPAFAEAVALGAAIDYLEAAGHARHRDAPAPQHLHRLHEPLALGAEQMIGRHARVLEDQLRGVGGVQPELAVRRARAEA